MVGSCLDGGWEVGAAAAAGAAAVDGGNGRALGKRANTKVGRIGAMRSSSSWGSGGSGGCELLADGNGRALGKRPNALVGKRQQRGLREGRAAVDGGWQRQGAREASER